MKLLARHFLCALVATCPLWVNCIATAGVIYGTSAPLTGTRDASAGELLTSDPDWSDGLLSWDISGIGGGLFQYSYTLSNYNKPAISHFSLDITDDAFSGKTLTDFNAVTSAKLNGQGGISVEFGNFEGITGAVKFDVGGEGDQTYSFISNRSPVWGDFYLKGGQTFATNLAFGDKSSMNPISYIARPNGLASAEVPSVPEPSSIILYSILTLGILGYSRYVKQRKTNSILLTLPATDH